MRCAIYTRKSTEEGLEQEFNSLHAQREACEAYIRSQRHEGWRALPEAFDDGGYSGGTLERPGLQRLLEAVRARRIDAVVVYKVDRLSRSLTDFARIVELFEAEKVSFVSVTQQFNTTTSMGRLTLNVLLSFAQFEREVTAERIRDKIAASRKKGLWTGGPAPLGYDVENKRLVVNPSEAETVRLLYRLYLELGSVRALLKAASARGIVTKRHRRHDGTITGGRPFSRGNLYQLLKNPLYVGRVSYKGTSYPGQHEGIIDDQTWEAVQARLSDHAGLRRSATNTPSHSVLAGLLYDETGDRLRPTHANKKGRRYRYYISSRLQAAPDERHDGWRLPAPMLEKVVIAALIRWLRESREVIAALEADAASPGALAVIAAAAGRQADLLDGEDLTGRSAALRTLVQSIVLRPDRIDFELRRTVLDGAAAQQRDGSTHGKPTVGFSEVIQLRRRGVEAKIVLASASPQAAAPDAQLSALLARANRWFDDLASGTAPSVSAIALRDGVDRGDISRILPLAFLAPSIVVEMLEGRQPPHLTANKLQRLSLPACWKEQERVLSTR